MKDRLPPMEMQAMNDAQRQAAEALIAGPRKAVVGPFIALLRSPELLDRMQRVGEYLRFKNAVPQKLVELAILITARQWGQNYEWQAHRPLAEKAGLKPEIAQAVADGRRPSGMAADEKIVFDFCSELHANKSVSDATYQRALEKFGEQGIIDLTAVNGYYSFNAMILNVARTALPANVKAELQPFPR